MCYQPLNITKPSSLDSIARRALGNAVDDDTIKEYLEDCYAGAFPSKEVFAVKYAAGYGLPSDVALAESDLPALTKELFERWFSYEREGDVFHVFARD